MIIGNLDDFQWVAYASTALGATIGLHAMFLLARSKASIAVRLTYPIVFTLCVLFVVNTYVDLRGYPVRMAPTKAEYIHHEQDGDDIILWLVQQDGRHRMFVINNSDANRAMAEEAKKGKDGGQQMEMEIKKKKGNDQVVYEVEQVNVIDPETSSPKED